MLSQIRLSDLPSYILEFEKNYQEGFQKGFHIGTVSLLLRLLRLKFGELPQELISKIEQADMESLLKWSDRLFSGASLDEVMK